MLFFVGVDSMFAFVDTVAGYIEDEKVEFFGSYRPMWVNRLILCVSMFIFAILLNFDGGFYLISFYDSYSTIAPMLILAGFEAYAYAHVYGLDKLD